MNTARLLELSLEMLVLRALRAGSLDAYAIIDELQSSAGEPLLIEIATIHPVLYRLEGKCLIAADWRPAGQGTRRMQYSLTDEGEALLNQQEAEWHRFADLMNRLLEGRATAQLS